MQEGGGFFRKFGRDLASVVGPDARALLLAFAMCAGAATYLTIPFQPAIPHVAGVFGVAAMILIVARQLQHSDAIYALAIVIFGMSAGFSAAALRTHLVAAPVIDAETRPVMLEGWISDIEAGPKGSRLQIKVHSIAGLPQEALPKRVRVTHRSRLEVSSGRFVRCWVVLRPPPSPTLPGDYDFRRQAYFQQLGAVGYVQGRCRGGALGAPPSIRDQASLWVASKRRVMALYVNEAAGERAGGLATALITGDRSFLRNDDQLALRDTGLAHMLSISGMHLSIVGGLTYLIVRRSLGLIEPLALRVPVQKIAAITGLAICTAYLIISGASVSTQRAYIMAAIVFLAVIYDRSAISLRTFCIAMIVIILLQPDSVLTPGFQMSYAATGALIAAYEVWRNHRATQKKPLGPVGFAWASIIITSVVCDAATAPFSFYHFDRLAPMSLFANFAVMPVVSFVAGPAAALAIILALFGHADLGLRIFGQSLELVLEMTHYFYNLSPSTVEFPAPMPAISLAFLALAIGSVVIFKGWPRLVVGLLMFAPAMPLWMSSPKIVFHWSASGDAFVANAQGYAERIELADGDSLAPLRFIEAEDLQTCQQAVCQYVSLEGAIITISETENLKEDQVTEYTVGIDHPTLAGNHIMLDWETVRAAGGITVFKDRHGVSLSELSKCTNRPWRSCEADSSQRPNPAARASLTRSDE